MKVLLFSLLVSFGVQATQPQYLCESVNDNTKIKIVTLDQTPYSNRAVVSINGVLYHTLKHQRLTESTTHCISKTYQSTCLAGSNNQDFIEF